MTTETIALPVVSHLETDCSLSWTELIWTVFQLVLHMYFSQLHSTRLQNSDHVWCMFPQSQAWSWIVRSAWCFMVATAVSFEARLVLTLQALIRSLNDVNWERWTNLFRKWPCNQSSQGNAFCQGLEFSSGVHSRFFFYVLWSMSLASSHISWPANPPAKSGLFPRQTCSNDLSSWIM